MPYRRRRSHFPILETISAQLGWIRDALIQLNGKADMLFSVLSAIRNDQVGRQLEAKPKRKRKGGR